MPAVVSADPGYDLASTSGELPVLLAAGVWDHKPHVAALEQARRTQAGNDRLGVALRSSDVVAAPSDYLLLFRWAYTTKPTCVLCGLLLGISLLLLIPLMTMLLPNQVPIGMLFKAGGSHRSEGGIVPTHSKPSEAGYACVPARRG